MATITISEPRATWPDEFLVIARAIRAALGATALRIDHIGSTAVAGLAAKDIIDIQVTVEDLGDPAITIGLESMGATNTGITTDHLPPGMDLERSELDKLLFALRPPLRPANIHVRQDGRFNQGYALLCRDFLRSHPDAVAAYAEIKQQLAKRFPEDPESYYDIKDPVFDLLMAGARVWAVATSWEQGPSGT